MRPITCLLLIITLVTIVSGAGTIQCYYQDTQRATSNTFTAFSSTIWTNTTQADFNAMTGKFVDVATVPGDVLLSMGAKNYHQNGYLISPVWDTGKAGSTIDLLYWDEALPPSTTITFSFRASDTWFDPGDKTPAWINVGTISPVSSGLPMGRYVQWQVDLTTSDNSVTPALHEVQVWYH